ncbi:hypothetical protein ANOM_002364 [Aspergillus nomiae NRRL 13137]|uniref:MHD domain-containing protein n=1 Tax=Aspergillus nomiae NRRL (strain ATCC 15546 / NRRL 13137 / CBS 260.88 / M93) TaxID=1509407 RepID=A0A0L1JDZ3_ASPN3|nr:uncharacterized protein ANOM_002364 [Aspergillus nomiae NRRL 13137]KNG89648.1 hypothetical protein ANOM_002364 [Aspergillus nomiae NRRL 13137]
MMDLSRQEYPALLTSLQPGQATGVLSDRIRLINKINADIADWLQERRRVEEAYAQGLRKLATRQQLDNGAALGIFQIPWQRIVNATEMVASSHETFAQKIEEDVERPLRDYHTKNRELASLPGVQSDLATLAKNLEASLKKVDKAREKGPKGADKLAGAVAASEGVRQEWESRAPFAFEQLQAADESRLNHLRDALTQLETHESDQVERCRQATETCLNVLLNVETADEIKTFAEKVNGGRPVVLRQQTSPTPVAPPGPPPRLHDDTASQRSETSGPIRTPPALPDEERPGTALTTQESHNEVTRIPSETNDHEGHGTMTSIPTTHSVPTTANGTTSPEPPAETGIAISDSHQPRVDSEGFSEPPQTIDKITRAQREAAGMEEAGINLTIRDQPIFEDEDQAKQAMDDMANQLRLRAQQTGVRRNVGTLRGRRDVRNTVFIPNPPQASDAPTLQSGSDVSMPVSPGLPSKHAASPSIATEDHALSDTTSVRSGHTLHGSSGAVAHPDLHEPGLNASIIETVNAWFSDGVVTKSSVIGELALAYNGTPEPNTTVRLENFQVLEKVAANPHFVNEEKDKDLSDEKRGQYSIHIPTISRPSPTVAFKYQLHVDASDSSAYCPVIFKPVWNIEEHQASVIIFYSLNPSFTSSAPKESITLKNLVLTVNLDTSPEEGREVAHATNAVMYPNTGASFRRKHSAVTWKMPEFEVKAGSDGKLLVRFSTATSWPRKGKVDAKFEVNTLDAGSRLGISAALPAEASTPKGSDPFADEDSGAHDDTQPSLTWKEVPTTRKLVGGKYVSS